MNKKLRILRVVLLLYLVAPLSCTENRFNCTDSSCGETFEQEFTEIDSLIVARDELRFFKAMGTKEKTSLQIPLIIGKQQQLTLMFLS